PADNQTLTEGKTYTISGSATDLDNGNVVTIKYKINNGTPRAINSGVSDGSTPISFNKTLTYRNKRLWDGSTDVVGYDLAEGTNHTLTVWAEDDKEGKSPDTTRTFTVTWNRPPVISGQDKDLGTINTPPSESFSVTDPEGNPFTIEYYLDNVLFDSFAGVDGQTYTVTIGQDKWLRTSLAQHQLKIRAIDNQGAYSDRIFTFTRTDDKIEFTLNYSNDTVKNFFTTNQKANRILVTMDAVIPTGAVLLVEACNNAYDAQPTWEDITSQVLAKRGYQFTNTTSTSGKWGINVHFRITKGTATETVILNGFGGAFD
ncbi:Ig-like domain-containing protein, partial [Brevibacillus borstelensis]|uniref:Ig-like domain-containing protein n=1 Tax=Brevibacillus borstelensis TaxID=45462 RepID=UPI00068B68AB